MALWTIVAATGIAIAGQSAAAPAPVDARFYNQPGATPERLATELRICRDITTGPGGVGVGRQLSDPLPDMPLPDLGSRRAPVARDSVEDCMVQRGWRVFLLDVRDQRSLARRSAKCRARLEAQMMAAPRPRFGRLVRAAAPSLLLLPGANGVR